MTSGGFDFRKLGQNRSPVGGGYGNPSMQIVPRPFGQLLGDAINGLGRSWRALISPALWAFIPVGVATLLIFRFTDATDFLDLLVNNPEQLESLPREVVIEIATPLVLAASIAVILQTLAALFVYLASHRVIAAYAAGEPITGAQASRFALSRYWTGLLGGLIAFLTIAGILVVGLAVWLIPFGLVGTPNTTSVFIAFLLFLALLGPGIWLSVSFSMWTSVVAVETRGAISSLRRSLHLVRGRWWPTFGFLLMVGLLGSVAVQLIQLVAIPLSVVGDIGTGISIASLIGILAQGLIVSGIAAMYTFWYIDLRARGQELATDELM